MQASNRLILILFFLIACFLHSAMGSPATQAPQMTTAQWKELTSDKSLNYAQEQEADQKEEAEQKIGWYQKVIMALFAFLQGGAGTVLVWLAILGIVGYVVYRLIINSDSFLFKKSKKPISDGNEGEENDQDISNTNWEALLHQAINNKDTRLAVRYSYMRLLQLLQQQNMIQYRQDKTNYEYFQEIQSASVKPAFKQLSRLYEYTWYGRAEINAITYNDYIALFNNTRKQLGA